MALLTARDGPREDTPERPHARYRVTGVALLAAASTVLAYGAYAA